MKRSFNSRTPGGVRRGIAKHHRAIIICFNSRTPGGVRQEAIANFELKNIVSIHAPREGCDRQGVFSLGFLSCFNSRTPGGVRLIEIKGMSPRALSFQFTHPGRGATTEASRD